MTDNPQHKIVDHLFRHQYGKMVAILTHVFGLAHIELVEDAVQDTFIKATLQWRNKIPANPEAWLTQAAKNRLIDLLRQKNAQNERQKTVVEEAIETDEQEHYLEHEIEDNQLRMLFVACHPAFSKEEQIAFALKTISGFSMKEIAAALLQKEETIKKRLIRARKKIHEKNIVLDFPEAGDIEKRMSGVCQIIYLIFNEGFHSTKKNTLVDKDLCGEALRLCKLILQKKTFRSGIMYALFALLCFHAARLESKLSNNEIVDLKYQDRSTWYLPLIVLGNDSLAKSRQYPDISGYYYEAAIAAEHVKAITFENTNWQQILEYYKAMYTLMPSTHILLANASIHLQMDKPELAKAELDNINPKNLAQRSYLYYGCLADYHYKTDNIKDACTSIEIAIQMCPNILEKQYLEKKKAQMLDKT